MTITMIGLHNLARPALAADSALWLVDAAAKSAALLVAVGFAAWLLRRRSAATVHRVWTLGFCGCLLIPIATYFAPLGTLPIIPDLSATITRPQPMRTSSSEPLAPGALPEPSFFGSPAPDVRREHPASSAAAPTESQLSLSATVPSASDPSAPVSSSSAPLLTDSHGSARLSWTSALLVAWLAGVALCSLRWLWQHAVLRRVLRRCRPVQSSVWTSAVAEASQALGFKRDVKLVTCDAARTPAVAGVLRTIIILPQDADGWSADRRQLVLLHELGHAQRRDLLTQAIARAVCAVYWFNPLCWLGLIQMGRLRELACDDLVLASGQPATDYADVLLGVARSYRQRNLGLAVGMARRANVEDRILAILDRARNRISLSPRAARRWALGTFALVLLLGCLRTAPTTEADESSKPQGYSAAQAEPASAAGLPEVAAGLPTEPQTGDNHLAVADQTEQAADDGVFTMNVRIADEKGQPLEGASLHVSVWEVEESTRDFPNRNLVANAEGIIDVELPRRLRILRMWPAKLGYVPEFINFAEGTHDEGLLIPDKYEFRLAKGTELSGIVVDEEGQPISGVKVEVKVGVDEPAWTTKPDPMISTWLTDTDFNCDIPVTNTDGRWSISNAPAPVDGDPYVFRLKHTHPDYVKDTRWGELQERQEVTTAMLRAGTARIVLPRGATVNGTVVGPDGQPVTQGLVIWHDNPYLAEGVNETEIGADGRFETLPLSAGEYPITVVAPGFAPVRRKIAVAAGMDDLNFELEAGNRLVLKIVDPGGNPLPKAYVQVGRWGESEALYNHKHPNVPESGIPRQADENGIYTWDWAPVDGVAYAISAKDYAVREFTFVANGTEQLVELSPYLVATGRVTDAQSGAPIETFAVIPVTEYRPQFLSTSHNNAAPGKDGTYEVTLADYPRPEYRYRARIEAPGYRSVISEQSFSLDQGRVVLNFELEPAPARIGKVIDAEGHPVGGASIVVGSPSDVPMMRGGALDWGRDSKAIPDGTFELPATFEPVRIRAIHASGIAEVLRQPDEEIGTLQLQPWAKVSGQLVQDGQPVPEQIIIVNPIPDRGLGEARFQDSYQVQTDAQGHFEFGRLPPGRASLRAYLGPWQESPLTSSESIPLDLAPGEQRKLALGGAGITVTGNVNDTGRGDVVLNKNWSLSYLIRRDAPSNLPADFPALSFDPSGPVESSWFLAPDVYKWLATRPNYFVKLSPDGDFRIHGVPPGQYDLVLRLYEQPAGCLVETIGMEVVPIAVTADDAAAGTKEVGTVDVACRVGPRVGENMQAYKIVDRAGQQRTVQELQGQHVLLHVWASWCAPCLQHMPEIQSSLAGWKEQSITVVGLNIDEDRNSAQTLVESSGWDWSQMYLGDDSDMARQLAISTVPTYYLIGPDGLLLAAESEWSTMKAAVDAALARK